jgi:SH3-like domain-containing protein
MLILSLSSEILRSNMTKTRKTIIFALLAVFMAAPAVMAPSMASPAMAGNVTGEDIATADGAAGGGDNLPVPRFVSLATGEVNLRTGPGMRYPVKLVVRKSGLPVEVVREFDVWRQVRDIDGDEGWVHKSMLSGRRSVIVKTQVQTLLRRPDAGAKPVARLEPGVIARLQTCNGVWCQTSVGGYNGWLKKETIWGVYPDEAFKE